MEPVEPKRYFIIYDIAKRNNVISLLSTAFSFNFTPIIIGSSKLVDAITINHIPMINCENIVILAKIKDLKDFLQKRRIPLIGIEISTEAFLLNKNPPFSENIAFMPGNEGRGMSSNQIQLCDHLICIPHYGDGVESLNVCVASSIVLNEYNTWLLHSK